jgi:hypothetical protein
MNLTLKYETELILTEYYPRANTTGVKGGTKSLTGSTIKTGVIEFLII